LKAVYSVGGTYVYCRFLKIEEINKAPFQS